MPVRRSRGRPWPSPNYPRTREVHAQRNTPMIGRRVCSPDRISPCWSNRKAVIALDWRPPLQSSGRGVQPNCDVCGLERQTLKHWLWTCPSTAVGQNQLFGEASGDLGYLTMPSLKIYPLRGETCSSKSGHHQDQCARRLNHKRTHTTHQVIPRT